MTTDYEVKIEPGFIRFTDSRPVTAETIRQFCAEIPKLARSTGIFKILVDDRKISDSISTMERFKYGAQIAEHFAGLKIAGVMKKPLLDPQRFGETVAVNRGGYIRVFETMEEASDWLGVDPDNKADAGDAK